MRMVARPPVGLLDRPGLLLGRKSGRAERRGTPRPARSGAGRCGIRRYPLGQRRSCPSTFARRPDRRRGVGRSAALSAAVSAPVLHLVPGLLGGVAGCLACVFDLALDGVGHGCTPSVGTGLAPSCRSASRSFISCIRRAADPDPRRGPANWRCDGHAPVLGFRGQARPPDMKGRRVAGATPRPPPIVSANVPTPAVTTEMTPSGTRGRGS